MSEASGIRVLHVDDDPALVDVVGEFLEQESGRLTVQTATSAEEGLDRLADVDFDCVVSDYSMPGRDGIEFLERVRETCPDLPFILFTGKGSEEIASDAISAGVTDYLQKESGPDQYLVLANRIENAVDQYRTERQLAETRERMAFALEATDSIVFEVDLETLEDVHHGPFEDLYGVPKDQISKSEEFNEQCVHPADRERITQYREPDAYSELGENVEFEFRTNPENGTVRWIHTEAYIETDEEGNPRRLIGIDTDVTDRRDEAPDGD